MTPLRDVDPETQVFVYKCLSLAFTMIIIAMIIAIIYIDAS